MDTPPTSATGVEHPTSFHSTSNPEASGFSLIRGLMRPAGAGFMRVVDFRVEVPRQGGDWAAYP